MVSPPPASSLARTAASNATSLTTACSRRYQFHVWFNQFSSPNPILVVEGFEPTSTKRMNRVSDYQWLRSFSDMTCTCKVGHNIWSLFLENCSSWRSWPGHHNHYIPWKLAYSPMIVYHWCTIVACKGPNSPHDVYTKKLALIRFHNKNQPLAKQTIPKLPSFTTSIDQKQSLAEPWCWETPKPAPNLRRKPFNKDPDVGGNDAHPKPMSAQDIPPAMLSCKMPMIWSNPIHVYLTSNYANKQGYSVDKIKWNQRICLPGFAKDFFLLFKCLAESWQRGTTNLLCNLRFPSKPTKINRIRVLPLPCQF